MHIPMVKAKGSSERKAAKLANAMIRLLEKSQKLQPGQKEKAENIYHSILELAKQSKIESQHNPAAAEFALCSLIFKADIDINEYMKSYDVSTAREIYDLYPKIRKAAQRVPGERANHYKRHIERIYKIIISDVYPNLMEHKQEDKTKPVSVTAKKLPETIPRLHAAARTEEEKKDVRLANMMISLLEKFFYLAGRKREELMLVMNDLLRLAKENRMHSRKNSVNAEFTLCSLIISMETLTSDYEESKSRKVAAKINSAYNLLKKIIGEVDKPRIKHYMKYINDVYERASIVQP